GFASLHAGEKSGECLTHPLLFRGKKLIVNHSGSAVGTLRVELQNAEGTPLPGFSLADCQPVTGDQIASEVTWERKKGTPQSLENLAAQPVRLRLVLQEMGLYSLQFQP